MLKNKVAVIYGAGGAIGGAVAQAFAREGARLFLTGRRLAPLEAAAREIGRMDCPVEVAEVDALDAGAVEQHMRSVIEKAGRVDISFNAVGLNEPRTLGVALAELDADRFSEPIAFYARTLFATSRAAAKPMVAQKSGVIMTVSALPARTGTLHNGGYGAAMAAKEALIRDLSCELARNGIRALALCPHGLPETETMKQLYELKMKPAGMNWEQFTGFLASTTHSRRTMLLEEVANMAAFLASDGASSITGTTVNMTLGALHD